MAMLTPGTGKRAEKGELLQMIGRSCKMGRVRHQLGKKHIYGQLGYAVLTRRPGTLQARFLAVISHELRTPLTTIASFTESLDTDDLAPTERSLALSAVRRNTERMLNLVEDLMVVSRLQTGDLEVLPAPVDVAAVIRAAADRLADREPPTAATLDDTPGPRLAADERLLGELFYAVLGTVAGGAADRSATITARAGPDGWTVTVTARQAGELTDEHLMAGMLASPEPPYRRRSTALWMLLADAIATRHDGSVELTYDPGTGAGAEIWLPWPPSNHPAAALHLTEGPVQPPRRRPKPD
jgi:K+-sensing histidine kinase KdpD